MLYAAALLIHWLVPNIPTVTSDLPRLLPDITHTRIGELPCITTNSDRHVSIALAPDDRGANQGQAEMLDLLQQSLASQLLSQQPINSVTLLAELPHRKEKCSILQATHRSGARVSNLGGPSTNRSKSMKSARRSKDSLQHKRLTDCQKVLSCQQVPRQLCLLAA